MGAVVKKEKGRAVRRKIHYVAQWPCHGYCLWENKSGQKEKNQDSRGQRAAIERCDLKTHDSQQWVGVEGWFSVISGTRYAEGIPSI